MRLVFALLVLGMSSVGQKTQTDRTITEGSLNGRGWKVREEAHIYYVAGVLDGMKLAVGEITFSSGKYVVDDWRSSVLHVAGFNAVELKQEIDQFCAETANLRMPVAAAFRFVCVKIKGASTTELEDLKSQLRKNFNQ